MLCTGSNFDDICFLIRLYIFVPVFSAICCEVLSKIVSAFCIGQDKTFYNVYKYSNNYTYTYTCTNAVSL